MKLRLRHIVALYDEGLDVKNYELIRESTYDFKFRNKENNKIVCIRY